MSNVSGLRRPRPRNNWVGLPPGLVNRFYPPKNADLPSMQANPLTSHVLDTARGVPAHGVQATLSRMVNGNWIKVTDQNTNADGRLGNLIPPAEFTVGVYKMFFNTKEYYDKLGMETFYPYVEIVFEIKKPNEHYHVPLLLSPFGFSTYRGS